MEEEPHRYEDAVEDTDPDYTTPSGIGDDTTDGDTEDATTDDDTTDVAEDAAHTDGSQSKRQRKDRRPNVLGTIKDEQIVDGLLDFSRPKQQLRERGYNPITVDLSELLLGGGGIKCCTLELRGAK